MEMQILVLGGSNSIVENGWVDGFREGAGPNLNLVNASVGALPGSNLSGRCASDLSTFDFVIFESIPDDENIWAMAGSWELRSRQLLKLFSAIAAKANLVVLGFAKRRYSTEKSEAYRIHAATTKAVNGEFMSVVDYALSRPEPIYMDETHISPAIARQFGVALARLLQVGPGR